ncbi:unnamed protein product, partial [Cladocopium goreaui]
MAKACAVAGRPAILERITQWEGVVNTLKAAIAVATWDDPQVLLREMEGCRLPLANIVEPMLGGGNAEGAYDTLAEVYKNTPDGFLAMCPYPPGGEVDLLIVSDSSLALAIDDIESTNRAHGRPVLPVLVIAVADCHLAYLKLISVDDHLRTLPRIDDLQEQKNYPNLTILKAAYQLEIDSNVSSPKDLPQRPDPEKLMLDADIEIFNWVLQAEESATASADWEVESWMRDIPEEDQALEPMRNDNADSDDEAVKVQALTMDDRILARRKGLSEEHDQEWQDATYAAEDEDEDFKGWDLIEDDKCPPGVVASDPVHEEEKELDLDDLETVASVEIVDEEEFHDAEEGQAEPIDDDDDDDMAVIDKVSSMQASKSDARGDPEPMDVDDQGNKMVQSTASAKTWKTEMAQSSSSAKTWKTEMAQSTSSAKTWRTDTTAAASAGATPPDPTSKLKPKKKAMPKRLKVVDEGHGPSAEQFDTSKFATAQDLVWIEPDNMAGVPVRKVDYGRTDLSMDFKALVRHLQGERLVVRKAQVDASEDQGHSGSSAFLVEQGGMSSMIKTMFTFDENFDQTKIDDPSVHPAFSAMPEGSPQEAKAEFDPTDVLMSRMEMLMENAQLNFEGIKERIEFGKLLPFSRREDIEVEKSTATREGEPASGSQLVSGYTVGKMAAMTSTDACGFQRRGRNGPGGGNWSRGQGRHGFELQFKDISYNQIQDTPQVRCSHPICGYLMMDGHLKCPRCFRQMEPVTDANIATEVARREAAGEGIIVFFDSRPDQKHLWTYGNLRDMAKNYVRSFKKRGFKDLVDRLVRDPFFQFNAANQNLVPEALLFIERLAGCVSPTIERTKAQVLGEKLEMATKLIFVPSSEREPDQPLDLHTEVFVSHRGVFLDIGQFAVYVAKFIKPRQRPLPIVYGWGNRDFVPDASDAKEIAKELVEFSKLQWSNFASQQTHKESETTGDDREVSLPHASAAISRPEHERPHHEQFEPNLGKPARGGPYGQGGGGKGHHKGGGQTKGKGQQKGKGKQGRSPPGGVAYGDFEGDSYWVQGYRYTWYWNQQRGRAVCNL